jgi:hypothetical protein
MNGDDTRPAGLDLGTDEILEHGENRKPEGRGRTTENGTRWQNADKKTTRDLSLS